MPPYLAGREDEQREFKRLLKQVAITDNLILTGLRGVGKTVLLENLKPLAQTEGWLWANTDLSESASVNEERIARRILTDLAPLTSPFVVSRTEIRNLGFRPKGETLETRLDHSLLQHVFEATPGLVSDKLKTVLEFAWEQIRKTDKRGIVFAYDEAQTMSDHSEKDEFPLAVMLEVFQSIQRKGVPFMLVLTGLPTLFAKLVASRTYSERMFHVMFLNRLSESDSRKAIEEPLKGSTIRLTRESIDTVIRISNGYPYFIQFVCREVFDLFVGGQESVPVDAIISKLDADFFAGRWQARTDRQRELLCIAAELPNAEGEFTVQELTDASQTCSKPFTASHINQMLASLCDKGLVFKNRHGRYSFAVPLLDKFIRRQSKSTIA